MDVQLFFKHGKYCHSKKEVSPDTCSLWFFHRQTLRTSNSLTSYAERDPVEQRAGEESGGKEKKKNLFFF